MTSAKTPPAPPAPPAAQAPVPLAHGEKCPETGCIALNSEGFVDSVYRECADFLGADLAMAAPSPDLLAEFFEEDGTTPKNYTFRHTDIREWPQAVWTSVTGRGAGGYQLYQNTYERHLGFIREHLMLVYLPNPGLPVSVSLVAPDPETSPGAVGKHYVYILHENNRTLRTPRRSWGGWPAFHRIAPVEAAQAAAAEESENDG